MSWGIDIFSLALKDLSGHSDVGTSPCQSGGVPVLSLPGVRKAEGVPAEWFVSELRG